MEHKGNAEKGVILTGEGETCQYRRKSSTSGKGSSGSIWGRKKRAREGEGGKSQDGHWGVQKHESGAKDEPDFYSSTSKREGSQGGGSAQEDLDEEKGKRFRYLPQTHQKG